MNQPNNQTNMSSNEIECNKNSYFWLVLVNYLFPLPRDSWIFHQGVPPRMCETPHGMWVAPASWGLKKISPDVKQKWCQYPIESYRIHVIGLVYLPTWKPIDFYGFSCREITIVPWMRHGYCQDCEHCNGCDKSHSKGPMAIFRGAFHRPECWYQIGWFKRHFWVLKAAKRHWKVLVCSLRCLYSIKVRMFLYQHVLLIIYSLLHATMLLNYIAVSYWLNPVSLQTTLTSRRRLMHTHTCRPAKPCITFLQIGLDHLLITISLTYRITSHFKSCTHMYVALLNKHKNTYYIYIAYIHGCII